MLLKCFATVACILLASRSSCAPVEDEESMVNSLPDILRQSPSTLVTVLNVSSPEEFHEETIANASAKLTNTSLSDIENDDLTHAMQIRCRQRKKQERLTMIQQQILSRLRVPSQPNASRPVLSEEEQQRIRVLMEHVMQTPPDAEDEAAYLLQSSYPSCSVPLNTDRESWEQSDAMRVSYEVPYAPNLNVVAAKLRLFKTSTERIGHREWIGEGPDMQENLLEELGDDAGEYSIHVHVYQYMKPLRSNKKEKKRLVDSQSIPVSYNGWVEFNVTNSLKYWFRHNHKNFGFDVRVEDASGHELNPNTHFQTMNCSADVRPLPNLQEVHGDLLLQNGTNLLLDNETFPTLDLRTERAPEIHLHKRATDQEEEDVCVEHQEYVSFESLGITNIINPKGFHWTSCEGHCEVQQNATNVLESPITVFYRNFFKLRRTSNSSGCNVVYYGDLPMYVIDKEGKVSLRLLKNFVPLRCGCKRT